MMQEYWEKLKHALLMRQYHYKLWFQSPPGVEVLKDLCRFCRMHESTFHADPRIHALLEGRREVVLRIAYHLNLTPDQLWELYSGRSRAESE